MLSEYHDGGAVTGMFMIRHGRFKYVHYPGFAPELFDREADPDELHDLGTSAAHAGVRGRVRGEAARAGSTPTR